MSPEVNIKQVAPQQVLSAIYHIKINKLEETIHKTRESMVAMLKEQKMEAPNSPFGIFHGAINEQEDGPLEICLPVDGQVKGKGDIQVKVLDGGMAACVMMLGAQTDFPAILGAYDAAADWIQKNGHEMAAAPREIWHSNKPGEEKMEIVWLFK